MRLASILVALFTLFAAAVGHAEDFPNRYITLIVPLAPGSGTDAVARLVAAKMGDALGQQVVIENKVGANGAIGTGAAARAEPDGYTLLVGGTTTHAGNPNLMKSITYNPVTDFAPVGQLGVYPYVLLVSGNSPYRSLGDLVAAAKVKPGSLSFAYANALGQLSGEMLKHTAGIDITAVAYRGSPQAITDIIGGRVTMLFVDLPPAASQIEAGAVRPLAVTTGARTASLPNVPTMGEAGFPGPRVEAWNGLFAPANTPPVIVEKLSATLNSVLSDTALQKQLAAIGFEPQPTSSGAFAQRVRDEVALWATLTKQAGLEPQ